MAAGWAIDLFLGEERRAHDDIDVAVPRDRFDEFRDALEGLEVFVVGDGVAHAVTRAALERYHQTWFREPDTGLWRVDILREPVEGETWICRRDPRITLPYEDVIERTSDGIAYMRPEVVLLFKAKLARPKDDADFTVVLPRLDGHSRAWLANALELVHPRHKWLHEIRSR